MPLDLDWGAFFTRYRPLALRIARGLTTPERAEELVQDAAQAVIERARSDSPPTTIEHARNLFLRALRHAAISDRRSATRRGPAEELEEPPDPTPGADTLLAEFEEATWRARQVRHALDDLSEEEREALDLRYGEGLAYKAMTERTGRAVSTLQARVEAALRKIRARIGTGPGGA